MKKWLDRRAYLVAPSGDGPVIAIDTHGVTAVGKPPFSSKADLTIGIATGQALLQRITFAGSPYATPNPRNFDR